ncbi:tetratricopeptide repeat protein [Saccharopolyspora sp. NPDC049357]|uniref:ATP-binding protein n=1 Tax=Saccharopolyspora sp. NPDC049357 TaxID=3154507 RepID=UPI003429E3C3
MGSAVVGSLLQAGEVNGDVHFHESARRPVSVPRELPEPPGAFTGRETELAALTSALDAESQLASTVVVSALGGAGGIGKTWLALHWAHKHAERFPDGQLFVNLRGFDPFDEPLTPREAVRGFLDALGVASQDVPPDLDAQLGLYRSLVAGRRILIVLDNARDSTQVVPLLPGTSTCTVLVTSRDRLAGLVTRHNAQPIKVGTLGEADSRALLARRVGQARLDAEAEAVAELIRYCAGLPLALSIVAGRAVLDPQIPLAELAAELRDRSSRLEAFDAGEPTACLEAVLSWSYQALDKHQSRVLGLMGLAPGADISLAAVTSLSGVPMQTLKSSLRALENVSLVSREAQGRYRMHDLVRLYTGQRARQDLSDDEVNQAGRRLVEFSTHTAHAADLLIAPHHAPIALSELPPGCQPLSLADEDAAWAWFDTERANLLATQHFAVTRGWHAAVWQLAWAMTTFQLRQGHFHDNLAAWKAGAHASHHLADPELRTRSYRHLGRACTRLERHDDALTHLREGLAGAERDGDELGQAHTHRAMADAWGQQENHSKALEHAKSALRLYEQRGVEVSGAHALNEVGWYTAKLGDHEHAQHICGEALAWSCRTGNLSGEARARVSLGRIARYSAKHQQAVEHLELALELYEKLGDTSGQAEALDHLAAVYEDQDPDKAAACWQRASTIYREQGRYADVDRIASRLKALNTHRSGSVSRQENTVDVDGTEHGG